MRLRLALAVLLAAATTSRAAAYEDFIAEAFPACAELRDAMQVECWTPLVIAWQHGEEAVEGSALWVRCTARFEAAIFACPGWPRMPRPRGWRTWYRRVLEWGLPDETEEATQPDDRPGCAREPRRRWRDADCG